MSLTLASLGPLLTFWACGATPSTIPSFHMDIAPFARVVTCDPNRKHGTKAGRLEEFPAEDLFLEEPVAVGSDGSCSLVPDKSGLVCIGLVWPERRFLRELSLVFIKPAGIPSIKDVRVEYWSSQGRADDWAAIGQTLWQGEWSPLPGRLRQEGPRLVHEVSEDTPELKAHGGGTQKIRWVFSTSCAVTLHRPLAITRSLSASATFRIQFESPQASQLAGIEVYNGAIEDSSPADPAPGRRSDPDAPLSLKLTYTIDPALPDRTVIRIRLPDAAFGIAVDDILKNGCVYVRDFGVFATTDPPKLTLLQYKEQIAGRKTTLEEVRPAPDQTFTHARQKLLNPRSNRDPMMLSLACDNNKFIVHRDGAIQHEDLLLRWRVGSGKLETLTRHLANRWYPIPVMEVVENGLIYSLQVGVAPTGPADAAAQSGRPNARPLCTATYTIVNPQDHSVPMAISLAVSRTTPAPAGSQPAEVPVSSIRQSAAGAIIEYNGKLAARMMAESAASRVTVTDGVITCSQDLPARSGTRIGVCLPGWEMSPDSPGTFDTDCLSGGRVENYWRSLLSSSMQIETPEPLLNDLIQASQVHCLIAARNQKDGALVEPWIASSAYGPLDTEAQAVIGGMDLLGHAEFSRRSLDFFVHEYNPRGFLARGYTLMGLGQNLWTIGEHYRLTGDDEWLKSIAPGLVKACRWIIEQRHKTVKKGPDGELYPESGLLPPGVLADWNRYAYYFYAEGYYFAGLKAAAEALKSVRHPDADALLSEADAFRKDILRAYRWNQARMPVLPLANGTWVPAYPSSIYCFGRTRDFYSGVSASGHDVEAGGPHLINHGVLDPRGRDADWIVNDLEDFWYWIPGLAKYPPENMKEDRITYGGFSKLQPYYTRTLDLYALRDDVKPFIRSYFNTFFPMLSTETLALWEHFNTMGAWNKTHETGWFLRHTRYMLVMERDDSLWLAPFVTTNWLKDGLHLEVRQAPTYFGPVGYRIESHVAEGFIRVQIDPPTRNPPKELVVRLRHPEGKAIAEVTSAQPMKAQIHWDNEAIRIATPAETFTFDVRY